MSDIQARVREIRRLLPDAKACDDAAILAEWVEWLLARLAEAEAARDEARRERELAKSLLTHEQSDAYFTALSGSAARTETQEPQKAFGVAAEPLSSENPGASTEEAGGA